MDTNLLTLAINIVEFLIALGILAGLHEFGHFIVSKACGIEVEEFGFGFPPRMVKLFTWGGTQFTFNWIPFGAFVRPKGENDPNVPGGLGAASPWARLGVLLGGPITNLLVGVFLFALLFTQTGAPDTHSVQIIAVNEKSPAALAGIQTGDIVVKVSSQPVTSMESLSAVVRENLGKEITLTLRRDTQTIETKAVPRVDPPEGEGALGITMSNPVVPITWFKALPFAAQVTYEQMRTLILLPGRLIQGQVAPEQARVVGPKGMFDIYQQARIRDEADTSAASTPLLGLNTIWLLGTISIALGLTNLFPIPALDGGRILFVLPELIFRKRVRPEYENMVHTIGFALLLAFMVYVTMQDFLNPIVLP